MQWRSNPVLQQWQELQYWNNERDMEQQSEQRTEIKKTVKEMNKIERDMGKIKQRLGKKN